MKRILSIALALILVLGLCACGKEAAKKPTEVPTFQVGFGRTNITPSNANGLTMEGYSGQVSEGVFTYIMSTCVAIRDPEGGTLLLYTVDKTEMHKETIEALRARMTEATGIPGDNITISATHTHSSPKTALMPDYINQLVMAGEAALADLSPATIQAGSYDVPNMNFVRHYIKNDGTYAGDNYGSVSGGLKDYASEVDRTMQLIRFVREDKKDVLMVNWQVHPKLASTADTQEGMATRNMISADLVGFARDYVEAQDDDLLFAYYTGASGNVNPFSKLSGQQNVVSKNAKTYGEQLGGHVISALADLKDMESGNVGSKKTALGDRGFNLHAYNVGGSLGFATVPAEIFDTTGKQIREGSPYEITFVLTCANGRDTYIPVSEVWDYTTSDSSIPYEVRICRYPRGTAETLAQDLVSLLTELHG